MAIAKNQLTGSNTQVQSMSTGIGALKSQLATSAIQKQLKSLLKENVGSFMMAIVQVVEGTPQLQECEPQSIINSALVSATLKLPIEKNLGFAYIVPYKDNKTKLSSATFQLGYKGYIQLALRTGQYKFINSLEIKEGEIKNYNLLTGEFELEYIKNLDERINAKTIGYASYIEFINGFQNTLYMTVEQVKNHAKTYSQSYKYDLLKGYTISNWSKNFTAMALKTVLKLNLSKYGALSVDMQKALQLDGSQINNVDDEGTIEATYGDNNNDEIEIIGVISEKATNEEKAELIKNSMVIKMDIQKHAQANGYDFENLTKEELKELQEIIDSEIEKNM